MYNTMLTENTIIDPMTISSNDFVLFLFQQIDLNKPMTDVLAQLSKYPVKTRLSLTGTLVVARDIAHAKLKERLDAGEGLPDYIKNHPVYYAGPAKKPEVGTKFYCHHL